MNPLAPWIWFGALVMAAGGALSLADRRLRIGAPARRSAAGGSGAMTLLQRRALLLAPLGAAVVSGTAFWMLLDRMSEGTYDPHSVPSMLIGKPLPQFSLSGQPPGTGFSTTDVLAGKHPVLVNFFASWCIPCVQEAPVLMQLKQRGIPIWGIAYKDKTSDTDDFLKQNGDPYTQHRTR